MADHDEAPIGERGESGEGSVPPAGEQSAPSVGSPWSRTGNGSSGEPTTPYGSSWQPRQPHSSTGPRAENASPWDGPRPAESSAPPSPWRPPGGSGQGAVPPQSRQAPSPQGGPGQGAVPPQAPGGRSGVYGSPGVPEQGPRSPQGSPTPGGQAHPYGAPPQGRPRGPGPSTGPMPAVPPGHPGGPQPYGAPGQAPGFGPPSQGQPAGWAPAGGGGMAPPPSGLGAPGMPMPSDPFAPPRPAKRKVPVPVFVAVVAATALVCGLAGGSAGGLLASRGRSDPAETTQGKPPPGTVAAVAARVLPSAVTIDVTSTSGRSGGSGFVMTADGYIMTNSHVVDSAKNGGGEVKVQFHDGETVDATVRGASASADIAVLKVERSGLKPVTYGESEKVRVGDPVIAIGSPLGLEDTTTTGIVSAINRPVHVQQRSNSYVNAIQTDAAINPGNSGGPLFDERGRLVGVNYAGASVRRSTEGPSGSIGLGFAIPEQSAQRTAKQLMDTGKSTHAVMGTTTDPDYEGNGAKIVETAVGGQEPIQSGGPAEKAGLQAGDVIVKFNDQPIHTAIDMIAAVRSHAPNETCTVVYERDGQRTTAKVTLGEEDDET